MKKSTKLISLILAVVMVFSATCISAGASAIPSAAQGSIETLVQNKNLAEIVGWLITNLNAAKGNITGTVLKLVYLFAGKNLDVSEETDVTKLSDEQLAKILLDYLDKNLPEWTKDLTEQSWWGTVSDIVNLLGVTLDLKSVDGILETVYTVCNKANSDAIVGAAVGDLKDLNGSAVKGVKRSGGDMKVIYAVLQWVNDNQKFVKAFVIGGISNNGIKLGNAVMNIIGDNLDNINNIVKNIPDFAKAWVYLLIDGYAEKPDIQKNPKGGWGTSPYADYSADEMLAAALINLINDSYKKSSDAELVVVPKAEAQEILGLTFYGLLAKYGKPLYTRFAVSALNNALKEQILKLKDIPDAKDIFNYDYQFTDTSFNGAFADADTTGFLGQLNNILYTCLETMLTPATFKAVDPVKGGNENLNGNLAKLCRHVLPILANHSKDLGFDFSKFTADAVKDMDLPEMAVAVLKIFFPTWFKDTYDAKLVNKAGTVAQLGLAAVKFAVTNKNWVTLDNGFSAKEFLDKITPDAIGEYTDAECIELIVSIGAKLGAYTLDAAKAQTHFELDKDASAKWTWKEYCDEIVDWAIAFAKGFPAVMVNNVTAKRGEYDGFGPFYKVNVALNELIDFSFLSNVNDETFRLDSETLIFDTILNNACNFDVEALVNVFAKNTKEGNFLNGPVIKGTIGIVDRILTALFSHTCGADGEFEKELDCTHALAGTYDKFNGHYKADVKEKDIENHNFVEEPEKNVAATCGEMGTQYFICTKCGVEKPETTPATGEHDYQLVEKDPVTGAELYKCTVCGDEKIEEGEPEVVEPEVKLGDVDGDDKISSADARLALRRSVGLETYKEDSVEFLACDVDKDNKVTSADARLILRASVGLEDPATW